jgi:hypothetical protein
MANHVYVIELERAAGRRRDPRLPWLYVGSSARRPEDRFAQHLRGYKAARLVKRFGFRLRPDLYEDLGPIRGKRAAVEAEEARARELAAAGFVAHSDGVSYGRDPGTGAAEEPVEWDAERLEPVAGHLDAAIAELAECSFAPLDAERIAELLYGARGFWVAEFIDPADPPPSYGLFPHVRLDVLADRAMGQLGLEPSQHLAR